MIEEFLPERNGRRPACENRAADSHKLDMAKAHERQRAAARKREINFCFCMLLEIIEIWPAVHLPFRFNFCVMFEWHDAAKLNPFLRSSLLHSPQPEAVVIMPADEKEVELVFAAILQLPQAAEKVQIFHIRSGVRKEINVRPAKDLFSRMRFEIKLRLVEHVRKDHVRNCVYIQHGKDSLLSELEADRIDIKAERIQSRLEPVDQRIRFENRNAEFFESSKKPFCFDALLRLMPNDKIRKIFHRLILTSIHKCFQYMLLELKRNV